MFLPLSHPKATESTPKEQQSHLSVCRNTADSGFWGVFSGLLHEITQDVKAQPNPSFLPPHSIGPVHHMT